jgi:hypothetical protein
MNGVAAFADHGADMFIFNVSFAVGFGFPHCAALGKNVHCGGGKAFEAFDRLGFTFQPGVGTLAGLTGGGTGIEIADGGGQMKGIGEDESVKRVNHLGDFLSLAKPIQFMMQ